MFIIASDVVSTYRCCVCVHKVLLLTVHRNAENTMSSDLIIVAEKIKQTAPMIIT